MQQDAQQWLKTIDTAKGWYFSGFTDGEGSFNASLRPRGDHQMDWKISLSFNVSQRELYILAQFKQLLGCGRIRRRSDGVHYYEVTNIRSIMERVIPFFQKFPFLSQTKKRNFLIFVQMAELMSQKAHLQPTGFEQIVRLREQLNKGKGRKRKYTLADVI